MPLLRSLTLVLAAASLLSAGCGKTIAPRLFSVTHGNGRYVAVGERGVVVSSGDLKSWTAARSGTFTDLTDVHFGNGRFVAVGDLGTVLVSEDGTTWSGATTGTARKLNAVTYFASASLWIAVGDTGEVSTSPDGLTWTVRHSGSAWLAEVAVSDLGLVAVEAGAAGELSSSDGIVWTRAAQPFGGRCGVAWSKGTWVSVDFDSNVYRHPGPASSAVWQTPASGLWTAGNDCDVAAGADFFVVVDAAEGSLYTSPDGTTWSKKFKSTNALRGAVVEGAEVVAVGSFGEVAHAQCPSGVCGEFTQTQISVADDSPASGGGAGGGTGGSCTVTREECCGGGASLCGVPPSSCDGCPDGTRKGVLCAAGSPCNTSGGFSAGSRLCHCL